MTPDNAAPKCVDQIALEAMQDVWNIGNRLSGETSQKKAQIQVRIAEAINEALSAKLGRRDDKSVLDFANEIISGALQGGSYDGGDIQELAEKYGLIVAVDVLAPCGSSCVCADYGFPSICLRKTDLLRTEESPNDH